MPIAGRQQRLLRELLPAGIFFFGMAQEKFPILILLAAGLLDVSGASSSDRAPRGMWGLSFAGAAQPKAQHSPVPVAGGDWDQVTSPFQSPGAAPSSETASGSVSHPGRAANRTALLPGNLGGAELLHTAALKPQHGHTSPGQLWSGPTQGSQATTALALQREPESSPGAALSPPSSSSGLPQPFPSGGTQQDPAQVTALSSPPIIKQREVPSPKTSLLTPTLDFHPPGRETAASPFPPGAGISAGRAGQGWLPTGAIPTGKRPQDTSPPAQADPTAGVTPAHLRKTQSSDAGVTTSAIPPQPAPGGLGSVYSRPVQVSPLLQQETTGDKGRNSASAVTNSSGHPAQLPAPHILPPGSLNSSSFLMEAPAPEELLPSPFQVGTTDGQKPLSLHRAPSCTKQSAALSPPETNRSSQETAALALQRDSAPWAVTGRPGKSLSPESPQPSPSSSSLSQVWISTSKPSTAAKELKEVTSPLSPGMPTFGNADLQPWDSVPAGLQPPGAAAPPRAGMQPVDLPTPTTSVTSPAPGSRLQGASAPPVPRGALAGMLQVSTGHDSRRRSKTGSAPLSPAASPVPKTGSPPLSPAASPVPKTGSPPLSPAASPVPKTGSAPLSPAASPVPSPSGAFSHGEQAVPGALSHGERAVPGAHSHGDQAFPPPSLVPPGPTKPGAPAPLLLSSHSQGSHPSPTTAHPAPGVPSEVPAPPGQALVHQFRMSLDAAARNLGTVRGDSLTLLPSSPHLAFVLKSSDGMICLQPTQDSPLPTEFPNASVGGLVSIQQILAAPNSSALDLARLQHLSPSSVVLVRPVFVLLPSDRAHPRVLPSPQGDPRVATSVGTTGSSQDIPVKTSPSYPAGKSVAPETALSTASKQEAERAKGTSESVPADPNPAALRGLSPAVTSSPARVLAPRTSPTAQTVPRLPEEMQIPAPHPQRATGTVLLSLSAEPGTSPVPPALVPTQSPQPSPKLAFTMERPQSSPAAPSLPAKGLGGSPEPAQPGSSTGAVGQGGHGRGGSVPTPSSAHAPCTGCLTSSPPPRAFPSSKPLQPTPQRLPGTKLLPSPAVPSTSSASSVLPAGSEHSDSREGSTARSGVPVPATAAQTPIAAGKPGLTQRLELELAPTVPQPFTTTQRPTLAPEQTPLSTEIQRKTPVSGKVLAVVTHAGMSASSPAPAPAPAELFSQASTGQSPRPAETSPSAGGRGAGASLGTSVAPAAAFSTRTPQPPSAALGSNSSLALTPAQPSASTGSGPALEGHPKPTQGTSQAAAVGTPLPAAEGDGATASLKGREQLPLPAPALQPDPSVVLNSSGELSAAVGKGEGAARGEAAPTRQLPTRAPVSAAQPASPRLPLAGVSHPLEVSHPLDVSHPLEKVSHPLEKVSHPLDVSHPLEKVSHPLEEVSHPLDNISHPLEKVSHPLDNISHPLEKVSHPVDNVSHPLPDVSHPLEEASHPLEVSHPLEKVSHPLDNVSHPLDEISHPLDEVSHPLENMSHPLQDDAMEQDSGPSSPGTAAGPPTPAAVSVPANWVVNEGTHQPAVNDPELLPARDLIQDPPVPESPSHSPGSPAALTAPGDPWLDAAGTDPAPGLLPSTEEAEEEEGRTREVTDGAAEALGTAVTPEPGALGSDSHQRRGLRSDVTVLDGLAIVSDSCGSGNHSVRLSLSPAGTTAPGIPGSEPSQDTFLALVALQSNSSPALLQIHSCCVTPSASPGAAGAQCCLFRRLPWECRHIQLLQDGASGAASFSIQLFQMLNHSVAYLHCELRVCVPGQPGCQQDCLESVEPLPQPSDRSSYGNPHSLVSLGPLWRTNNRFLYKPVEGAAPAVLLPLLLGSLAGCAVLGSAFMGLWLHHRQRAKPSPYPPFGEFQGL